MSFGRLGSLGRGFGRLGGGGKSKAIIIPGLISAGAGGYTWTGQNAGLVAARTLAATGGSYTYTGQDASLIPTGASKVIAAGAGSYAWTGDEMTPLLDYFVTASGGSYAWTGSDATLTKSGSSYVGPGDIVSGAYAWYGLRAYNAAYATGSNPALDLVDQANANPITVNILSTGRLDVASISAWVTANSVSTIKVKRMYDQSGNARHLNQATLANMPTLNLTGFGSLPAVVFTAASSQSLSAGGRSSSQPLTSSIVYNRTVGGGSQEPFSWNVWHISDSSSNFTISAGTSLSLATTNGSWHAAQSVFNGASGAIYIDGSSTTGAVGSAFPSGNALVMGLPYVSNYFNGSIAEAGWWAAAFNSTQAGDMNTNQHGANGHNF